MNAYHTFLQSRSEQNTLRQLQHVVDSDDLLCFTSNDYLQLSRHPAVLEALTLSAKSGMGQRGSRLVMPSQNPYLQLENKIAASLSKEKALLFASGFQANLTVLSALLDKSVLKSEPLVFCDRLMHASLHMACLKRGVKEIRYPHSDLNALEKLLQRHQASENPKFIITESLFGMDGDRTDIEKLVRLKEEYGAFLLVDEAHSIGCYGENGYGLCHPWGDKVDLITGSFSKAMGCMGGFAACSESIYQYLINQCGGLIYSNALPFPIVAAIEAAWDTLHTLTEERSILHRISTQTREKLVHSGFNIGITQSYLIPILIGKNETVMAIKAALAEQAIWVGAIRPPSVPAQAARLRLCLNTQHTITQIDTFIAALVGLEIRVSSHP
jgi:8-amino-7-oxononanoate synthase